MAIASKITRVTTRTADAVIFGVFELVIYGVGILLLWLAFRKFGSGLISGRFPSSGDSGSGSNDQSSSEGFFDTNPTSPDPLVRAIFSSGDGDSRSWLTGGPWNTGAGQMGNVWAAIKQAFGFTDEPTPETNAQGAQEVGLAPGPPPMSGADWANYFNGPLQG